MDLIFIANVVVLLGRSYIQCLYTFGCGPYFDDVRKKGQIFYSLPSRSTKRTMYLLFYNNNRIQKHVTHFGTPLVKVKAVKRVILRCRARTEPFVT